MIDPISAITMATSAYNVVTRMVAAGREFEDTAQQLGKWYSAVNDFRFAKEQAKNPPIFKRLFASGSIEEEALALLIQEKKIIEQEKEFWIYCYSSFIVLFFKWFLISKSKNNSKNTITEKYSNQ